MANPRHCPRADVSLIDLAVVNVIREAERILRLNISYREIVEIDVAGCL